MTKPRQLINPPHLRRPRGFSHVAVAGAGGFVFLSGQVALAEDFSLIGDDDLGEQTRATMRNLQIALEAAGASWTDVLHRTVYTTQPTQFATITAAIEEIQGSDEHPAQTLIGVTGFAMPGLLIEIELVAQVDGL